MREKKISVYSVYWITGGIIAVMILFGIGIFLWTSPKKLKNLSAPSPSEEKRGGMTEEAATVFPQNHARNLQIQEEYEQSVKKVLQEFEKNFQASSARDEILQLRTSSQYKNFHLDLVIALDRIAQGQEKSDQALIEEGLEKLNALKKDYPQFFGGVGE